MNKYEQIFDEILNFKKVEGITFVENDNVINVCEFSYSFLPKNLVSQEYINFLKEKHKSDIAYIWHLRNNVKYPKDICNLGVLTTTHKYNLSKIKYVEEFPKYIECDVCDGDGELLIKKATIQVVNFKDNIYRLKDFQIIIEIMETLKMDEVEVLYDTANQNELIFKFEALLTVIKPYKKRGCDYIDDVYYLSLKEK